MKNRHKNPFLYSEKCIIWHYSTAAQLTILCYLSSFIKEEKKKKQEKNDSYQHIMSVSVLLWAPNITFNLTWCWINGNRVHDVENFRLHKLISPTSALPKWNGISERSWRWSIFSRCDNVTSCWGEMSRSRDIFPPKKWKIYRLYPWALLTKMSLGGEDYGLIYNN